MAEKRNNSRLQWAVFGVIVFVEVGLVGRLIAGVSEVGLLTGAITVVAALLVVTIRVFDIGSLSVGTDGFRAELNAVKERIDETDRRITELFLLTMSPSMFLNLKKLAGRRFGPYDLGVGLERELRHLRDIGYIDVESIGSIPKKGIELSEFVSVTTAGERFVAFREQMEKEVKVE